jgi:hypothetical protein
VRARGSRAALSGALAALIQQLEAEVRVNDAADLVGPGGTTEWEVEGLQVRVERGRWWPEGLWAKDPNNPNGPLIRIAPTTIAENRLIPQAPIFGYTSRVRVEPKFEPFDRFDGSNWQTEQGNSGTPDFIASNAVRIVLRIENYRPALNLGLSPAKTLSAQTIAARNKKKPLLEMCAAPFAIPVCALLDERGEYRPARQCQYDRYFTETNRYCHDGVDCDVLPGSWYAPITELYCEDGPLYDPQRCQCAREANLCTSANMPDSIWDPRIEDCPFPWIKGRQTDAGFGSPLPPVLGAPCSQDLGQGAMACHFYPWAKFSQTGDHYGVVGLPEYRAYTDLNFSGGPAPWDAQREADYRRFFHNGSCDSRVPEARGGNGMVPMAVGDLFHIKPDGLKEPDTDQAVWSVISGFTGVDGRYPNVYSPNRWNLKFYDPANVDFDEEKGFRELGYPWFMGRVSDRAGYPVGAAKRFLDEIIQAGYVAPYKNYGQNDAGGNPLPAIEPYECVRNRTPQYGACNSHRVWYDNRCHRKSDRNRRAFWVPTAAGCADAATGWPYGGSRWGTPDYSAYGFAAYTGQWAYCFPELRANDGDRDNYMKLSWDFNYIQGERSLNQWSHAMTLGTKAEEPWTCETAPPLMPCPTMPGDDGVLRPHVYYQSADARPAEVGIWHARIPVIADVSSTARPCAGMAGSSGTSDPLIDLNGEWRVIGFVRAYIYDDDIGKTPPAPPGPGWNEVYYTRTPPNPAPYNYEYSTFFSAPPRKWDQPRVCDYGADNDGNGLGDHAPWGFNPTFSPPTVPGGPPLSLGQEQPCNMVRARIACEPGLIAGDYEGIPTEDPAAPAIVFTGEV